MKTQDDYKKTLRPALRSRRDQAGFFRDYDNYGISNSNYSNDDFYNSDSGYAQNNRGYEYDNEYDNGNYRNQYNYGNYRSGYNNYDYSSAFNPDYDNDFDERGRYNDEYSNPPYSSRYRSDYDSDYDNNYDSRYISDRNGRRFRDTSAAQYQSPAQYGHTNDWDARAAQVAERNRPGDRGQDRRFVHSGKNRSGDYENTAYSRHSSDGEYNGRNNSGAWHGFDATARGRHGHDDGERYMAYNGRNRAFYD